MIYTHIAWTPGTKSMAENYKPIFEMHRDEDWVCIIDSDAMMITDRTWYAQLEHAIQKYPKAKGFTCRTNRVNSIPQLIEGVDPDNHDIKYHKKVGEYMENRFYKKVTPHFDKKYGGHFSGMWFALHVGTMKEIGFYDSGNLSMTDNAIHKWLIEAGHEFYVLDGIYCYHYYRPENEWDYYKKGTKELQEHFTTINLQPMWYKGENNA